jgi:hypothetical protein
VNTHYGILASIGDFFGNAKPPSAPAAAEALPESQRILNYSADILSIGIWMLALAGAWVRRKSLRTVIALLLLAFSPIVVLVGGAYGNEGIMRVYLFSLPWSAALAAAALAPPRSLADNRKSTTFTGSRRGPSVLLNIDRGTLRAPLVIAFAAVLFLMAFYGDDAANVMPATEVSTILNVLQRVPPGPVFASEDAPLFDTAKYNLFGGAPLFDGTPITSDIDAVLARTADHLAPGKEAYVVIGPSMVAYDRTYGVTQDNFSVLLSSLARSPYWKIIANNSGTFIFELTAAGIQIPSNGPYYYKASLAVP